MNSLLSNQEIYTQVAKIISNFKVLQCADCAEAIKQWLKQHGVEGIHLKLTPTGREDFILSQRWDGSNSSITQNGVHYGVETRGKVFDNLSTFGLSRKAWVQGFICLSGKFQIEEIESF